jgi:lactate dehydrogenase-like 2-hydroxyacid dehydrogenase
MPTDIIVTAPLPPFLYEPLQGRLPLATITCRPRTRPALLASQAKVIRGLVQGGGTVTPTSLLDALPAIEIISVFGVGYDGVPVDYCKKRGLKVTNTPDVLTDDVADVAVALVMMTGRGLRAAQPVRAGARVAEARPELTTKLSGRPSASSGSGASARPIAQRVSAMGMKVAYTGRKPQDVPYRFVPDLKTLAAESDFLVVACPGGAATKNIVNADVLAALGKKGTLVNIARGSIVDEPALVTALQEGHDQGGGARRVRRRAQHSGTALRDGQRRAAAARRQRDARDAQAMGDLCKANLDAWFAGKPLPTLIPELA